MHGPLVDIRGRPGAHGRDRNNGRPGTSSLAGHRSGPLEGDVGDGDCRPGRISAGDKSHQRTTRRGVRRHARKSGEDDLLSAVYDFSWAGAVLMVFPLLGYSAHAVARRGTVGLSLHWPDMAACLPVSQLPIVASGAVPGRIGEFTPVMTGVLIASLAIAFGGLAWTPQRDAFAGQQRGLSRRPRCGQSRQAASVDRLTGISRVLVPHLLATLAVPVGACFALAAYGLVSGSGAWWFVPPAPTVFDPADTGYRGLTSSCCCRVSWPCKVSGRRGHDC